MAEAPTDLILEQLKLIRATQVEHGQDLAAIKRRLLAVEFNITRICRENAGDADTAMAAILDHDKRLDALEQRLPPLPA